MTDAVAATAETTSEVVIDAVSTPVIDAAAKAAADKAAAEGKETPKPEDTVVAVQYNETGDPGLDLALNFVGSLGIDEDHPAMAEAIKGDFRLIKAHLASLGDKAKGYEKFVALAEKSYQDAVATETAQKAAITGAVHTAVGGAETWAQIQAWAAKTADPDEKVSINKMLTGSPTEARAAALMLQGLYDKASGIQRNPADPTNGGSSRGAPSPDKPLSRREAAALSNQLVRKHGAHNIEQHPEYRALWARVPSAR